MLTKGDRVTLNRDGHPEGTVLSVLEGGASAYVRLDTGTACTFPAAELAVLASQSKAWPPEGIETK